MKSLGHLAESQNLHILILAADESGFEHFRRRHNAGETLLELADVDDLNFRKVGVESTLGNTALKRSLSAFKTGAHGTALARGLTLATAT